MHYYHRQTNTHTDRHTYRQTYSSQYFATAPAVVANYCDEYVCLCVCLSVCPQGYLRNHTTIFTKFLFMLPMSVARSSSGMFAIGRITCHREGIFFPIENALSAGKRDGSSQRGRSMLPTIALFKIIFTVVLCLYSS